MGPAQAAFYWPGTLWNHCQWQCADGSRERLYCLHRCFQDLCYHQGNDQCLFGCYRFACYLY